MRIFLHIESEPGVLARVLGPFSVAGHAPHALMLRRAGGAAFVVADFAGLDVAQAMLLAERLRQMPCVSGARLFPRNADTGNETPNA